VQALNFDKKLGPFPKKLRWSHSLSFSFSQNLVEKPNFGKRKGKQKGTIREGKEKTKISFFPKRKLQKSWSKKRRKSYFLEIILILVIFGQLLKLEISSTTGK
jgi:hypothetical protein